MPQPWERLAATGETAKAFDAFTIYRDLPPATRSLQRAARISLNLTADGPLTENQQRMAMARHNRFMQWSSQNQWVARATAWDEHRDEIRRADRLNAVRDMTDRHALVGRTMLAVANREFRRILEADAGRLTPGDRIAVAFAVEGSRLERAAYGLEISDDTNLERRRDAQDATVELLSTSPEVVDATASLLLAQARAARNGSNGNGSHR